MTIDDVIEGIKSGVIVLPYLQQQIVVDKIDSPKGAPEGNYYSLMPIININEGVIVAIRLCGDGDIVDYHHIHMCCGRVLAGVCYGRIMQNGFTAEIYGY